MIGEGYRNSVLAIVAAFNEEEGVGHNVLKSVNMRDPLTRLRVDKFLI